MSDSYEITIIITSIPDSTPVNDLLFVAGDFNGWFPDVREYRFIKNSDNIFSITFLVRQENFEYKITRGSWRAAECDNQGKRIKNRKISLESGQRIFYIQIENWEDKRPTVTENVEFVEDFHIPQLGRYRKIWIYLPENYNDSEKRYPVLYMHDGQNLFDEFTSYSGEWAVDKTLNRFFKDNDNGIIVVGIENQPESREQEYLPWQHPDYKFGDADKYSEFIVDTLKPYIDKHYRTKTDRTDTGIMGSFFGALISLYTGMKYSSTFGKIGLFSPSFWISDKIHEFITYKGKKQEMKFYFTVGMGESSGMVKKAQEVKQALQIAGYSNEEIKFVVKVDGENHERFWRREFLPAVKWLFPEII